jgi:hypothetical protein
MFYQIKLKIKDKTNIFFKSRQKKFIFNLKIINQ